MSYPEGSVGGYLPIFYINWIFKKKLKAADTHAQDILVNYQEGSLGGYQPTFYFDWI